MAKIDLTFRIGGEAGQGVESSGAGFAKALARAGLHVFAVPSYYSRIRGGHNHYTLRVSDEPLEAISERVKVLLAINGECVSRHLDAMVPNGVIIVDPSVDLDEDAVAASGARLLRPDLLSIAEAHGGKVMLNTALLAYAAAVTGLDLGHIFGVIRDNFGKRKSIADANIQVAQAAYDLAQSGHAGLVQPPLRTQSAPVRVVIDASHAFAMGALMAGCKFMAGYPMTPATSVLEYYAKHADDWGLVVKHAEDELAAINMCIGAAHAGVRAMTSTSGGGFDLMAEGLSLAGMAEIPVVVYLCQRPGPATGLATRTAQADLLMAIHASHGEYPRIVLAPHTPQEAYACGIRAHNLADRYQCPVIVLSDQYNATSLWSIEADAFDLERVTIERGALIQGQALDGIESYRRYALSDDGISPRAVPGHANGVYLATGNEHGEDGHLNEEPDVAVAMLDKRMTKLEMVRSEMRPPLALGPEDAKVTLLSWGSSVGPVHEAMLQVNRGGGSVNMRHWVDLWPFPEEGSQAALDGARRLVAVEGNGTGQFANLLAAQTGIRVDQRILKYDGRGLTPAFILRHLEEA